MNKFCTTYSLYDVRTLTGQRNLRTKKAIASVSESVKEDPDMSIRHRTQQLGLSLFTT